MKRIIGINKIDKIRERYRRPLVKATNGELLPDFRDKGNSGFDVTYWKNSEYLGRDSDIPQLLRMVNKHCPISHISGVCGGGTQMVVYFGDIELFIKLKDTKIVSTLIRRAFKSNRDKINVIYEGNNLKRVFNDEIVKNNIEYSLIRKELLTQYKI